MRLRVERSARPVGAAARCTERQRRERTLEPAHDGRGEHRPDPVLGDDLFGFRPELRRELDEIVLDEALAVVRERVAPPVERNGLCRRVPFARHVALRDGALLDRPDRLAAHAVEHIEHRLLRRLSDGLDGPAVEDEIREDRRARDVVVPDPVVNELEMPLALARLQIDGDQALAEQPVPRAVGAEVVARRQFHGQIRDAELLVDADLRPHPGVAGVRPRIFFPGVVAELTGRRNRVEDPQAFTGADIEAADVALDVRFSARHSARLVRSAHDDDVLGDDGGGVEADLGALRVDALVVVLLEIDRAVGPEALHEPTGPGVEGDQPVARRDVENARLTAIGPVREPAPRQLARGGRPSRAFVLAVHPQQLARRGVERDDGPSRSGRRVHQAARHQRRALELEFGPRTQIVGLEPPGDFELREVRRVDLRKRRVVSVAEIGPVGGPLPVPGAGLRPERGRAGEGEGNRGRRAVASPHCCPPVEAVAARAFRSETRRSNSACSR